MRDSTVPANITVFISEEQWPFKPGEVHNMLRARVCAAHIDGFSGPKFSKQGHFLVDFPYT